METDTTQQVEKTMALPFPSHRRMVQIFENIKATIENSSSQDQLKQLLQFVDQTWYKSPIGKPLDICAFKRLVRTNNGVEGYHRRLNHRCATVHPHLYKGLEVIHSEALLVDVTFKMVSRVAVSQNIKETLKSKLKSGICRRRMTKVLSTLMIFLLK